LANSFLKGVYYGWYKHLADFIGVITQEEFESKKAALL